MIETLIVLYVLIGFLFSVGVWNAYNLDNSPEKHSVPKWLWTICITGSCLVWPLLVIKYILNKGKTSE